MNWLIKRQLKNQKKRALLEVQTDIRFLEKYKYGELHYDEQKARQQIVETKKKLEKAKEKEVPQLEETINRLSREIAETQAIKKEFQDLKRLEKDITTYIKII